MPIVAEHGEEQTRLGSSQSVSINSTEADWSAVNKVRRAYERGGWDAFWSEFETFEDDLMLQIMVLEDIFPDVMRQAIKDELAEPGFTLGELQGLLKKTMQLATEH